MDACECKKHCCNDADGIHFIEKVENRTLLESSVSTGNPPRMGAVRILFLNAHSILIQPGECRVNDSIHPPYAHESLGLLNHLLARKERAVMS